jgi:hypothetical protein
LIGTILKQMEFMRNLIIVTEGLPQYLKV